MDLTHLHLLITHLPIYGVFLGVLVLLYGLYTDNHQTLIASYMVIILGCLGGLISYLTGESAEETMELVQGISKNKINEHEEAAELAFIGLGILGVLTLLALILSAKLLALRRRIALVILILSIICFAIVARTGYLGGLIRHTELGFFTYPEIPSLTSKA